MSWNYERHDNINNTLETQKKKIEDNKKVLDEKILVDVSYKAVLCLCSTYFFSLKNELARIKEVLEKLIIERENDAISYKETIEKSHLNIKELEVNIFLIVWSTFNF